MEVTVKPSQFEVNSQYQMAKGNPLGRDRNGSPYVLGTPVYIVGTIKSIQGNPHTVTIEIEE